MKVWRKNPLPKLPDKEVIPTLERFKQRAKLLQDEYDPNLISVEKVISSIDNLYLLAMALDGTLFKHSRNDGIADMLLDAYIVLQNFGLNHKHYVSPLPFTKTGSLP